MRRVGLAALLSVALMSGCGGGDDADAGDFTPSSSDPVFSVVEDFELSGNWETDLESQLASAFRGFEGGTLTVTCVAQLAPSESAAGTLATFECGPDDAGEVFTHEPGQPGYPRLTVGVLNGSVTTVQSAGS